MDISCHEIEALKQQFPELFIDYKPKK